jgi:hypothetical protein
MHRLHNFEWEDVMRRLQSIAMYSYVDEWRVEILSQDTW